MNHESLVEKYLGITNYHTEKIPLPPPKFQFGILYHFGHRYMIGGSSSELTGWKRIKLRRCEYTRVVRGHVPPGNFFKFSFSKTHIWRNLWENWRTEMNQNLRWKCTCKRFETPNVKRVTTARLVKLCFYSLYKQKMIWISAVTLLLQTNTQPLEYIGNPVLVFPSQTVCQKRNFRLGAFFNRYMIL